MVWPYQYPNESLVVRKRGGGERRIQPGKWYVDPNTPVGEDADIYEVMPHHGRRYIHRNTILRREREA